MPIDKIREITLKILYEVFEKSAYSNISINKYFKSEQLTPLDRAFITELVLGTITWNLQIDWIIEKHSNIKLKKISPWIINILRLGVYQLLYTKKIPESAACNESVKLAKKYGHNSSSGFVNAILRSITRNKNNINYEELKNKPLTYLSIKHSHPEWLVSLWSKRYGMKFTEELLIANNKIPNFTIRVNTLKINKDMLSDILVSQGYQVNNGRFLEESLIISNPSSILDTEAYKNGLFTVQDESSMLVSKILSPRENEKILDVCSAPGGKSTHMAELMKNTGEITSLDIYSHKIDLINKLANRLGISIIKALVQDATVLNENLIEKYDKVLVDAPCTGFGIIRKKPEIKWTKTFESKIEIIKLQKKILENSSKYVRPGGIMVYSTCTIEPEENIDMIKTFLSENDKYKMVDFSDVAPSHKESAKNGIIQLYPNIDLIDGFFTAKMMRIH